MAVERSDQKYMPPSFLSASLKFTMDPISTNEALIAEVQRRQPLYDKSHDNYSNRVYINRLWQEIGHKIGLDGQSARKKWTTLRDYFQKSNRQMAMVKTENGGDRPSSCPRKWYLYDSMLFLLPHIGGRITTSNMSPERHDDSIVDFHDIRYDADDPSPEPTPSIIGSHEDTPPSPSFQEEEDAPLSSRPSASRKRRFQHDPSSTSSTNYALDERMMATLSSIGREKLTDKEVPDEDEFFCRSLVSKIKMLDPFTKMECQAEIQLLILRYMRRPSAYSHTPGGEVTHTESKQDE